MKQILLIPTLFFSRAQSISTFAPVGAEWWYQGLTGFSMETGHYPTIILQYNSVEEIVYEGQLCRRVEVRKYDYVDTVKWSDEYVYNNEDTVFYFSNQYKRFIPLYIFNVNPSDTLTFYTPRQRTDSDTLFALLVDSVYFNSDSLQTVVTKQLYDESRASELWGFGSLGQIYPAGGDYTEKLGFIKGAFMSHEMIFWTSIDGHTNPEILCYKDSSLSVVYNYNADPVDEECLYPDKLSIDNFAHLDKNLAVYPNPAREVIQLKIPAGIATPNEIKVFDFTGKVVQTVSSSGNNQFSVQNLPQGIYTIAVPLEGNWYYGKMMKL